MQAYFFGEVNSLSEEEWNWKDEDDEDEEDW